MPTKGLPILSSQPCLNAPTVYIYIYIVKSVKSADPLRAVERVRFFRSLSIYLIFHLFHLISYNIIYIIYYRNKILLLLLGLCNYIYIYIYILLPEVPREENAIWPPRFWKSGGVGGGGGSPGTFVWKTYILSLYYC